MNIDDCFQLGYVVKVHGTKGAVVILLDTDEPQEYYQMESLFILKDGELIPFFIDGFEQSNQVNKLITYFEGVESIEDAQKLKGTKLYLPLTELPELNNDQFYYHDVIGYKLVDEKLGEIGTLKLIYEMPTNDMLVFDKEGIEIMIPIQEPIFAGINKSKKQFNLNLPDGYLEVFMSDPNDKDDEV